MKYLVIQKRNSMISLVMQPLNRAAVELAALADSISAEIWEISLEIFLEISLVAVAARARRNGPRQGAIFVPVSVSHLMMPSVLAYKENRDYFKR